MSVYCEYGNTRYKNLQVVSTQSINGTLTQTNCDFGVLFYALIYQLNHNWV